MSATQELDLQKVQKIRKGVLLLGLMGVIAMAFVTASFGNHAFHEGIEAVGLGLIVICIVGRAWCSLYIGGRKKAEIVDRGPYSISRNPLYVFSFMGAFGMGAQTGSLTVAMLFLLLTYVVFYFTVKREETWLAGQFGQVYADYCARTPRFGPDFSKWRDAEALDVRPRFFLLTIRDGLMFLVAIPLFEAVEAMQNVGWLATVLRLP
ncbi:isoprenylcysteine carboxylmethyltransferase family protein [Brevundimonas terrae]|uniref:Isoprenylcysteine carboxylmethyltransferase family protein n=1 Tax=Brevundimonas terrae TaxID=363631 RepID=A0ABP3IBI6_9CAUL|nr:isoprenylcysteine carboxylmethyltransferase family protein [Brevundimonas terrae]NIJ27182.1 protein-S-isoprenylcysteine O-methyltransferase Ste14 [Brevundimonas terrae]